MVQIKKFRLNKKYFEASLYILGIIVTSIIIYIFLDSLGNVVNNVMSFLEECCVVAEGAECFREELFSVYKTYCSKNGLKAMSQISFNKEVENLYPSVARGLDKVTRRKIYIGLGMPG